MCVCVWWGGGSVRQMTHNAAAHLLMEEMKCADTGSNGGSGAVHHSNMGYHTLQAIMEGPSSRVACMAQP